MKSLKIKPQLFFYAFIFFFFVTAIDAKTPVQNCTLDSVNNQNFSIRHSRQPISEGVNASLEQCVTKLTNAGNKSPVLVEACTHLIDYYRVADPSKIQQIRNMEKSAIR